MGVLRWVDSLQARLRDAIYKAPHAHEDVPRIGELAAIVRDHCTPETGLIVKVVNKPHFVECYCKDCGQAVREWMVEVQAQGHTEGQPHFYPVKWLKRVQQLTIAAKRA